MCSFATGCVTGAKTIAAAASAALKRRSLAAVAADEDEAEAEPFGAPAPGPLAPAPDVVPELVLVAEPAVVVVTFDTDNEAVDTADDAELVVWARDDVAWLTVETTVETMLVELVGSGTLVLVGSGTVVDVGSGTDVLVGSGTLVDVGSGTVVSIASAVGAAIAAAAAQSTTDLAHRPLTGIQLRSRANGCGLGGASPS
jgi:hypothetical protein